MSCLGTVFGYFVSLIIGNGNWKFGFLIEGTLEFFAVCIIIPILFKYFDKHLFFFSHHKENNNQQDSSQFISIFFPEDKTKFENTNNQNKSICSSVICNLFLLMIISLRSVQVFVYIDFMFWFSDYLESELKVTNQNYIIISFFVSFVIFSFIGFFWVGALDPVSEDTMVKKAVKLS